jgi:phosphoribosylformylglycinamidine synthase PurS subunit
MKKVKIFITPKKDVLDPQGVAVKKALHSFGFSEVEDVKIGKYIVVSIDTKIPENLDKSINEMCKKLLANEVIEEFSYQIEVD